MEVEKYLEVKDYRNNFIVVVGAVVKGNVCSLR